MSTIPAQQVDLEHFNRDFEYPYELRQLDFQHAMQDVYDFFHDVNTMLRGKGLPRLDDMLRPANLSGTISDMLTDALSSQSRALRSNTHHNGHPDLVKNGVYPDNGIDEGEHGVEVKSTIKPGGAVDTHGARDQTVCVFVYSVDRRTQPVDDREPLTFREVYLGYVEEKDFRLNGRLSATGTRTATLDRNGLKRLRPNWVYLDPDWRTPTHAYLRKLRNGAAR